MTIMPTFLVRARWNFGARVVNPADSQLPTEAEASEPPEEEEITANKTLTGAKESKSKEREK